MATLAPSLAALRAEVNTRWPHRDRSSDGWIGDPSHSSRLSDHNPDEDGVVHALDLDVDGLDVEQLLRAVIGDPRVWYVIHAGVIRSRTYGFAARVYTGSNPHETHVHVSIRYTADAENDSGSWFRERARTKGVPTVDLSNLRREATADRPEVRPGVRLVQRALNDRMRLTGARALDPDGKYGPRTRAAVEEYQRKLRRLGARPGDPIDGVVTLSDLRRLGRGRWKVAR